ncbi:hypothetical protein NQZ79_g534 [Umbelopsis isabellina]|nr:hypothetical protein NQZ79_g534 [Umbelopsis isabellina]
MGRAGGYSSKPRVFQSRSLAMMLPKLLGGRKKKDRRPTDLKIPLPRLNGIHNADLTDAQITALLSKPAAASVSHFNKDHFARTYKPKIIQQDDMLRGSANGPVLLMPKPGHPLPLAGRILRGEDHDKTQIESEHDGDHTSDSEESEDREDHKNEETLLQSLEVKGNDINHNATAEHAPSPLASNVVTAQSAKMSGHTPSKSDHSDFRSTPKIPGHYPMSSGSSEKNGGLVERASYLSEMSSNESQQTFETARQSPFSHLSSVRSTPSMSVLSSANLPDNLDPSNILYDLSLHRHSAPESLAVTDIVKHLQQPIEKPESLDVKDNAVAHHSQMESFPALLSPVVANLQSPTSSKGKSAGVTSSSVTSPASSINTTKAVSSAVTTPAQGSIKRINSASSPPNNDIAANSAADTNGHSSIKPLAESSTESNQTVTPNSRLAETSAEIEALRKQMAAIQQERAEWKKREDEHRAREREMLEQISRTQEQLQLALTQAGFFSGSRRSKNPTPTSQTSSGIVNNDVDTISSGSNRLRRKKSSGSQSHSKSSHHSRSRSASRGRSIPRSERHYHDNETRRRHHSRHEPRRGRSFERNGRRLYDHWRDSSTGSDDSFYERRSYRSHQPRRYPSRDSRWSYNDEDSMDSDYEERGRRYRRYARSLDPPSRTISRSRSGSVSGTPHAYHSAVEDEEQATPRASADHRRREDRHRRHAEEPRSRKPSDARTWPSKHISIEVHPPLKQGPNGKVEPSPVVTPKSILRNGGTLSRQSSAGSTVRKNNGRVTKQNM